MNTCRHNKAFPIIHERKAGLLWCPDCGAFRFVRVVKGTTLLENSHRGWVRPRGLDSVIRQLEKIQEQ